MPKLTKHEYLGATLDTLRNTDKEITKKIESLYNEVKSLEYEQRQIRAMIDTAQERQMGALYDTEASWPDKILYVLGERQQVLSIPEMARFIHKREPNFKYTDLSAIIRTTITRMKVQNRIGAHIFPNNSLVYHGIKRWGKGDNLRDRYKP